MATTEEDYKKWEYTEYTTCESTGRMKMLFDVYTDEGSGLTGLSVSDLRSLRNTIDHLIGHHDEMQQYIDERNKATND